MKFVVYKATNTVNCHMYGGVSDNFLRRKREHKSLADGGSCKCQKFYNAIRKYGWSAFKWEIVRSFSTREEAYAFEKEFIASIPKKMRYNICSGGSGVGSGADHPNWGRSPSPDTRRKMSESNKGKRRSSETRKNMSKAQKGKRVSLEARLKLSEWNRGKTLSEEHCRKISRSNTGKKMSAKSRKKMSEARKGMTYWFDRAVHVFYNPLHGEFTGTKHALYKTYNLNPSHVSALTYQTRQSHKGWRYLGKKDQGPLYKDT